MDCPRVSAVLFMDSCGTTLLPRLPPPPPPRNAYRAEQVQVGGGAVQERLSIGLVALVAHLDGKVLKGLGR
jgi:hypothetical protein